MNAFFEKTMKKIMKYPIVAKIMIFLMAFFIGYYILKAFQNKIVRETFSGVYQKEKFLHKKNQDIYDDFYVDIYDKLEYNPSKNTFEVGQIVAGTDISPATSIILDLGSGHGHQVKLFKDNNYNVIGVDKSEAMVKYAKEKYPDCEFKVGDALDSMLYPAESFTHINALYFTIYYIKNKKQFFHNCFKWLKPGGYLTVHLVNRDRFDPIMEAANPLELVSVQKHAPKRITNSHVIFNDFDYKCDFKLDKEHNMGVFDETIKFKENGHVRKQELELYMPTQKHILNVAKECGFNILGKINMVLCQYEYQYLYILYKPS